jgi:phage shock protein C
MKKLYRLNENKKAAGICSGIADIYHFDVTIVRLAFVFVTVLTQFVPGIVTYLIGWYLIPEKEEVTEVNAGKG